MRHLTLFKKFLSKIATQLGNKSKAFCSNNGGERISKEFANFYLGRGVKYEFTTPYTPAPNGVTKHKNRIIQERIMSMLS